MSLKGKIKADHIPKNLPRFKIVGEGDILVINRSEIEETVQSVMLPDRTQVSGGQSEPVSFTIQIPAHHTDAAKKLDAWYNLGKRPGAFGYKKTVLLDMRTLGDHSGRTIKLTGVWLTSRTEDEQDMDNEGEMSRLTYSVSADEAIPNPPSAS